MAAKVSAEGKDVATTKSEHYAHSTEPDIRLNPATKKPKKKKNWLKTDKLGENRSKKTKFGDGDVWRESTKLGPPSEEVDGWPGAKNGGKINDVITGAKGSGAKKVFVEKEIVYRHEDLTDQNAFNSKGVIDDKAGWEAYMKIVYEDDDDADTDDSGGDANTKGNTKPDQVPPKPNPPPPDPNTPPENTTKPCSLKSVTARDTNNMQNKTRVQSGQVTSTSPGILELVAYPVGPKSVELEAEIFEKDEKHPEWSCGTWKVAGPVKTEFPIPQRTGPNAYDLSTKGTKSSLGTAVVSLEVARQIFTADPTPYTLNVASCNGIVFRRTFRVFPPDTSKAYIEFRKADELKNALMTNLLSKLSVGGFEIRKKETGAAGIEFSAAWKSDKDWRCYCEGKLQGTYTVFAIELSKRFSFVSWPIPEPTIRTAQTTIQAINAAYYYFQKYTGGEPKNLLDLYVEIGAGAELKLFMGLTLKNYWQDAMKISGQGGAEGKLEGFVGVGLEFFGGDLFKARGRASLVVTITGTIQFYPELSAEVKGVLAPLSLSIVISWDLTKIIPLGPVGQWAFNQITLGKIAPKGEIKAEWKPWGQVPLFGPLKATF
jgi:hypothetical protein